MLRGAAQVGIHEQSLMSRLRHRDRKVRNGRALAFVGRGRANNQGTDRLLKSGKLNIAPQGTEGFGSGGIRVLQCNELGHRALSLLSLVLGQSYCGSDKLPSTGNCRIRSTSA